MSDYISDFQIMSLVNRALTRWYFIVGGVIAGALAGLVFSMFRPPVYEAAASIQVDIDYGTAKPYMYVVESRALDRIAGLFMSDQTLEVVLDELPETTKGELGLSTVADIRSVLRLDFGWKTWAFIGIDQDPEIATQVANSWLSVSMAMLDQAIEHRQLATTLIERPFWVSCPQGKKGLHDDGLVFGECAILPTATGFIELFGELREEISQSHSVNQLITFEPHLHASLPSDPALWSREVVVSAGALGGGLVGLFIALVRISFWQADGMGLRDMVGNWFGELRTRNSRLIVVQAWILIFFLGLVGGLIAFFLSSILPKQYEATAVLGISVDYNIGPLVDLGSEDRALNPVANLVNSNTTLERALDNLPQQMRAEHGLVTPEDLRPKLILEKRRAHWWLIATDRDPEIAHVIAVAWAKTALDSLEEVIDHSWNALILLVEMLPEDCIGSDPETDVMSEVLCKEMQSKVLSSEIGDPLHEILQEVIISQGILPIITYEMLQWPILPEVPLVARRGVWVLIGAITGLLIGGWVAYFPRKGEDLR